MKERSLYVKITPDTVRQKHADRADRLITIASAAIFGGLALIIAAVLMYADAAEWDYTDSLFSGVCGKWFICIVALGAVGVIGGTAAAVTMTIRERKKNMIAVEDNNENRT